MKIKISISLLLFLAAFGLLSAQKGPRWFFAPEFSLLNHSNHTAKAVGFQTGVSFWKDRLQGGFFYYGRSGPINNHTETLFLPEGSEYKGQSEVKMGVDHGAFGLFIAPQFRLAKGRLTMDAPIGFGQMGAGFYLKGEDRNTPDGRRVSEWENELMGGVDAGFGWVVDGGLRLRTRLDKSGSIEGGLGIHYTRTIGWGAYLVDSDYYNLPRFSLFLRFGN